MSPKSRENTYEGLEYKGVKCGPRIEYGAEYIKVGDVVFGSAELCGIANRWRELAAERGWGDWGGRALADSMIVDVTIRWYSAGSLHGLSRVLDVRSKKKLENLRMAALIAMGGQKSPLAGCGKTLCHEL